MPRKNKSAAPAGSSHAHCRDHPVRRGSPDPAVRQSRPRAPDQERVLHDQDDTVEEAEDPAQWARKCAWTCPLPRSRSESGRRTPCCGWSRPGRAVDTRRKVTGDHPPAGRRRTHHRRQRSSRSGAKGVRTALPRDVSRRLRLSVYQRCHGSERERSDAANGSAQLSAVSAIIFIPRLCHSYLGYHSALVRSSGRTSRCGERLGRLLDAAYYFGRLD